MATTYRSAGVNIEAGNELVSRIAKLVKGTHGPEVLAGIGGFASLYRTSTGQLLAASCDGVGTKLKVAFATGRHDTVGIDLVAMNVNDLICTGARPIFFLDYFACGKLEVAVAESVVAGITEGCRQAGAALLGGETAEMPSFYPDGEYDLAGFAVGLLEPGEEPLDGSSARAGDAIIGLRSSGLHSNGYSLARHVLIGADESVLAKVEPALGRPLADELLAPTRIYVQDVARLRQVTPPKALAHITGGGLLENPPRVLPAHLAWRFDRQRWHVPAVMQLIAKRGGVAAEEMFRTFNMGLGMVAVVAREAAQDVVDALGADLAWVVGEIVHRGADAPAVELL